MISLFCNVDVSACLKQTKNEFVALFVANSTTIAEIHTERNKNIDAKKASKICKITALKGLFGSNNNHATRRINKKLS